MSAPSPCPYLAANSTELHWIGKQRYSRPAGQAAPCGTTLHVFVGVKAWCCECDFRPSTASCKAKCTHLRHASLEVGVQLSITASLEGIVVEGIPITLQGVEEWCHFAQTCEAAQKAWLRSIFDPFSRA